MPTEKEINDYDSEPVRYCARCYSLKVKYDETLDFEYCGDCGCSDIAEGSIEEWEKKYEGRYGSKFAVKNKDPKKSFIFSLSIEQLKTKIYQSEKWREIIKSMYPHFPGGYSKIDSLLLFFNTVLTQNRLDELKLLLLKFFKY